MTAAGPELARDADADAALDRPLSGRPWPPDRLHPAMYAAEFAGTALLVFLGLSVVVALWGRGAPLAGLPLSPPPRRALSGFLFGSVGAAIAYSPLGRVSGAHINPAMTLAFWLEGKMQWRDATCYLFAARPRTQPFTPLVNPVLFAVLVWLEAPLSGASANPARSLGPALIGSDRRGWWVYWLGPALGAILAVIVTRLELLGRHRPHQARLFHFGHHGGIGHRRGTAARTVPDREAA